MGSSGSKRLHIRDISSGLIYLIDTGSDISLFLAGPSILKNRPCDLVLYAANDSRNEACNNFKFKSAPLY